MTTATAGENAAPSPGNVVALRQPQAQPLPAKIQYAHELANSGLLPAAYRRNPANVLWAIEFGAMLSLPPMAAITGVHVIEGKPTASAGLISALVRRAGHRLRVTGDDRLAVAEIVRCDDPEFTFRSEWTIKRAETAGLLAKKGGTWQKYPAAMLKARAISEVARDACEEALSGVHYTPEELGAEVDEDGQVVDGEVVAPAAAPTPQVTEAPADDPFYVRPEPGTDQEWLSAITEEAASFTTKEDGNAIWWRINEKGQAGGCTVEDASHLKELVKARWADLPSAESTDGTASDDATGEAATDEEVPF